ncbi:MAG: hypothetical protein KAI47_25280 [Deltaproteobacteria bacterium]|nr:hypothetical protein [Deltaproteobacteria bacterium]
MTPALRLLPFFALAIFMLTSTPPATAQEGSKRPYRVDDRRQYQDRSVSTVQGRAQKAAGWVKEKLDSIHVTPARLALALGLLGFLWSLGKNKRHVRWALTFAISLLLLGFGGAAMYFQWPAFN